MSTELEDTNSVPKFSCGFDLASLAVASDLLYRSWDAKSQLQRTPDPSISSDLIGFEEFKHGKFNVVAFVASNTYCYLSKVKGDLVSSEDNELDEFDQAKKEKVSDFKFLCSKHNPEFSINDAAISLFHSARGRLSGLKERIAESAESTPWVVTGQGLGGSVASLFTLWLLDSINPVTTKRPLCITFGSPLVGDANFQEAISQYSTWNSCFLHVVHKDDLFPCIFDLKRHRPFGTYLFCSESGSACFASPGSISELLARMKHETSYQGQQDFDYSNAINCLRGKVLRRDDINLQGSPDDSFNMGILTQLAAIGFQQPAADSNDWGKIVKRERKMFLDQIDPTKQLNNVKVQMAKLEWYKKQSAADGPGYYDSFKAMRATRDQDVMSFKKKLDIYWQTIVEEVEKKPQRADAQLRKRWLFGGTNYRRMVEPLHIADYYEKGNRNYITEGRPEHYRKLEELLKESEKPKADDPALRRRNMMASNMTEDSCFWAHVEEAMLSCESLKRGETDADSYTSSWKEFEEYVFGLIKNYGVSPEIFLRGSSFMKWWEMYDQILKSNLMGIEHDSKSQLIRFMRKFKYRDYSTGQ